jgi:hypothetical protein
MLASFRPRGHTPRGRAATMRNYNLPKSYNKCLNLTPRWPARARSNGEMTLTRRSPMAAMIPQSPPGVSRPTLRTLTARLSAHAVRWVLAARSEAGPASLRSA